MISNNRYVGVIALHAPFVTGPVYESSVMLRTEEHFGVRMKMLSPEEVFQHHDVRSRQLWMLLREVLVDPLRSLLADRALGHVVVFGLLGVRFSFALFSAIGIIGTITLANLAQTLNVILAKIISPITDENFLILSNPPSCFHSQHSLIFCWPSIDKHCIGFTAVVNEACWS